METGALLSNPVSLKELKDNYTFENPDFILRDDIWLKGILLIRSGKYLTESIIDKLMNFGICEVNIHLNNSADYEDELNAAKELKQNYMKTQNILIIDKEFKEIKKLAKNLNNIGFRERNIYGTIDIRALNRYLQNKASDYLFINCNYWGVENYLKKIRNHRTLKNMHVFLMSDEFDTQSLENKAEIFEAKLILKPVTQEHLKNLIHRCVDQDFSRLLKNDTATNTNPAPLKSSITV